MTESVDSATGRNSKVDRVAEKYGLDGIDDQLVEWYTREEDPLSLRRLADRFNRRVLEAAMEREGIDPIGGEVENFYHHLTDEEVSSGMAAQARNRLRRSGVDVGAVERDFVSYQTINRHLRDGLGVERPSEPQRDRLETTRDNLRSLTSRTEVVVRNALEQLASAGRIDAGEFDVIVGVTISCPDCDTVYSLQELLENEGCQCGGAGDEV